MDDRLRMLIGAGIGAAAMYYFDPVRGRYRRSLVANQLVHAGQLDCFGKLTSRQRVQRLPTSCGASGGPVKRPSAMGTCRCGWLIAAPSRAAR